MPFEKGHKLSIGHGRPKGSVSFTTKMFQEQLVKRNYDVANALLDIYERGLETYLNGHPDDKMQGLKIAADMAKEIASYMLPKLKSIEVKQTSPLEDLSPAEKLEKMKQAVSILEKEVNTIDVQKDGV
jgi:hypothetical protein